MKKSIYERILDLRNRISLDGDDTIYEEDYLLLDEVLDLIENIGGDFDADIEAQIDDYKKQEKLLELYRELNNKILHTYDIFGRMTNKEWKKFADIQQQIKELEK